MKVQSSTTHALLASLQVKQFPTAALTFSNEALSSSPTRSFLSRSCFWSLIFFSSVSKVLISDCDSANTHTHTHMDIYKYKINGRLWFFRHEHTYNTVCHLQHLWIHTEDLKHYSLQISLADDFFIFFLLNLAHQNDFGSIYTANLFSATCLKTNSTAKTKTDHLYPFFLLMKEINTQKHNLTRHSPATTRCSTATSSLSCRSSVSSVAEAAAAAARSIPLWVLCSWCRASWDSDNTHIPFLTTPPYRIITPSKLAIWIHPCCKGVPGDLAECLKTSGTELVDLKHSSASTTTPTTSPLVPG